MSFGCNQDRFIAGQITRMRAYLANQLSFMAHSGMGLDVLPHEVVRPAQCALSMPQPPHTASRGGWG